MRRLLHSVGRWRGSHCNTCGRRITPGQSATAGPGNRRMVHFNPDHCGNAADAKTRRTHARYRAARTAVAATAILALAAIVLLLADHNRHHARPELIATAASLVAFSAAQIIERRAHIRRLIERDPTLKPTTREDGER